MRKSYTFSLVLPVPRIAVLDLILYKGRRLFISKRRFLNFCATCCITRWNKCDNILLGNVRNTSVSFAGSARKLNHTSYKNRIIFRFSYLSSKEPAIRRSFAVLYIAVKGAVEAGFFFKTLGFFF